MLYYKHPSRRKAIDAFKAMQLRSILFGVAAAAAATTTASTGTVEYAPGLVLVKIKPGQTSTARAAYKSAGATVIRSIPQIGWESVRVKSGTTVQSTINKLKSSKAISILEPATVAHPIELPNDPMVNVQYSLTRMQLSAAWDIAKGNASAIVAIVDTGVDVNHPDLKNVCLPGYDFADNDTNVVGTNPHGTHCAGIAAAEGNNGIGIAGVAYGASILPVKIFSDGSGGAFEDAISAGIIYAADKGASVISMSFGGYGMGQMERDALDYAYSKNVVLVGGSGNDNVTNRFYPAAYEKVIAVGATDSADLRASFSNYGADWVDVAAPGVGIRSTINGNAYADYDGTSMATPQVAGLATLIVSRAGVGALSNIEVRKIIESNCDNVATWTTFGRVNAYNSILNTGISVFDPSTPTTPVVKDGALVNGTSTAIETVDGVATTIRSAKKTGIGLTGSMTTSFTMTQISSTDVRSATLSFVASGDRVATLQVYFMDPLSNKWVMFKDFPAATTMKNVSVKLDTAAVEKYMSNNTIQVLVRSLVPVRLQTQAQGTTKIDQLQITFQGVVLPGSQP